MSGRADGPWAVLAVVLSAALASVALRVWHADLSVPFWNGGDTLYELMKVKSLLDHSSFLTNPDLGAPFGQQLHDFPDSKPLHYAVILCLGLFSSDPAVVGNLFFLFGFPLIAASAFAVLRWLGLSAPIACVLAVLFALSPYHFQRNEQALFLGAYYGVPLSAYLILAVLGGHRLFAAREGPRHVALRWLSRRSALTLAICVVVGLLDLYYVLFTLLLLTAATLIRFLTAGDRRTVLAGSISVVVVGATLLAALSPALIHRAVHGANDAVAVRGPNESELFSLTLASLTLPIEGHRLPPLARYERRYRQESAVARESASIGLVATLGFAWLLLVALVACVAGRRRSVDARHRNLAAAALIGFLIATTGGVSALLAYGVSPQIRTWSRLAIFIAFFSLAALGLLLEAMRRGSERRRGGAPAFAVLLCGLLAIGVADQTSKATIPAYANAAERAASDAALVERAEQVLAPGAMVFQLPYVPFPESPNVVEVGAYDHVRPYLQSRTLRWSFGAMRGREADWSASLAGAPASVLLPRIAAAGFDAVYVDRRGYADRGRAIERQLTRLVGVTLIVSRDGGSSLFDVRAYAEGLRRRAGRGLLARLKRETLHPVRVKAVAPDFARLESDGLHAWWSAGLQHATIDLMNPDSAARLVLLSFSLLRPAGQPAPVVVRYPSGASARVTVGATPQALRRTVTLPPGRSTMGIDVLGFPAPSGPDGQSSFVQLRDMTATNPALALAGLGLEPRR